MYFMKKVEIDELVNDYSAKGLVSTDAELVLVEAALFVEDCFHLRLTDDDFTGENLGSPEAIRTFLYKRLGA